MPPTSDPTDSLNDLTDSGAPVESRAGDASKVIEICRKRIYDDRDRAARRLKVTGMVDSNAPMSRKTMERSSRKGDSNLNWREAKGQVLSAWTPYYDLTCEVPVCVDGDLDYAGSDLDGELMRAFAEEFHKMLFGWRGFDKMTQLRDWQMLVHGIGLLAHDDPWSPFPKAILASNVYVPDGTECDLENASDVMITSSIETGALWRKIENEKWARAMGWNPPAVKDAIMNAAQNNSDLSGQKWDRWQQALMNGDVHVSNTHTKKVQLCTLYVEEMDGSISQHIVLNNDQTGRDAKFLFSKTSRFENWDQAICPFAYDIGSDGTWHSVKGLGTEVYAFCELSNRIKNTIADLVLTGTKPMFRSTSGAATADLQIIKLGGYNILPPNVESVQNYVQGAIGPALEVSREFQQTLMSNTGTYRPSVSYQDRVERTAKEVSLNAMDQAKLTKGAHNRHYRGMDREYAEIWRRSVNPKLRPHHGKQARLAIAFQERCKKICERLQVPAEALQKCENIRAVRSLGLGSAAMRVEIAEAMMRQYPLLDPIGQNHLLRMYFATLTSFHSVESLVPSLTTGQIPTEDDSIATLENNALDTGGEAKITPRQNHVIHLEIHVADMEKDAQLCEAGQQEPQQCFSRLEAKGMHSHEHLAELQKNPIRKSSATKFGERLRQLAAYQDHLEQNLREQAAANPPQDQGQPSPEVLKVQGDLQLKGQKLQADTQMRWDKTQHGMAMADRKTAASIARADMSARARMKTQQ